MPYDPSRFDDDPRDDENEHEHEDAFSDAHDEDDEQHDAEEAGEAAGENGARGVPVALAATDEPVALRVALVEDERTPEGMVCMGTFRGDRLIARCVLPPEAYAEIEEHRVFDVPVPVILVAQEAPPGLQCRLFAMITLPESMLEAEEDDDAAEPWAASVPSSRYEEVVAQSELDDEDDEAAADDEDGPNLVPLPLGNIVRFERDRLHPDSLPREAMDILQKVIDGQTSEVVDRALADLLDL